MNRAEPRVTQLGVELQFCVIHVVLEVTVGAVAMILDFFAETHPLSFPRLPCGALWAFVLFMAEERHRPGESRNKTWFRDATVVRNETRGRGEQIPLWL